MSTLDRIRKIDVPRITRTLDLGRFHDAYKGMAFEVWVNPPKKLEDEYVVLQQKTREKEKAFRQYLKVLDRTDEVSEIEKINGDIELLNEEIYRLNDAVFSWYAEVWGEDPEKVREFSKSCQENGLSGLWKWVQTETWTLITMHLKGFEKN